MFKILKKENLAPNIYLMDVEAPRVARNALPGQFLIVRVDDEGERVPLTICDYDAAAGTVQIVFQVIGGETYRMAELNVGDSFHDIVGPLGRPSDLTEMPIEEVKKMKICFIAGGVGTAPVYCQLKWLHENGVTVDCIQGAKTKDIIILEDEMRAVCNLHICTDDGSYGINGNVTVALQKLYDEGMRFDRVVADEVRMSPDEETGHRDGRQHEPDHGRRNRHVRRLPSDGRRQSEVCLCGRSRVRRTPRRL